TSSSQFIYPLSRLRCEAAISLQFTGGFLLHPPSQHTPVGSPPQVARVRVEETQPLKQSGNMEPMQFVPLSQHPSSLDTGVFIFKGSPVSI
ncbi:hypothetical protein P692DRAFT_20924680, partial [Suillus brevipes Sb2]